jgi:hypothetical protein
MAARADCQKSRPAVSNPACCPGRASYLTRSRDGCPARQAGPGGEPGEALRHADAGFPLPGHPGWQAVSVSPAIAAWPAPGRRGGAPGSPVTGPPAQEPGGPASRAPARPLRSHCAGVPGRCPRRRLSGEDGVPGKAGHLPAAAAGRGAARLLRFRSSPWPVATGGQPSRFPAARHFAGLRGAVNRRMDWRGRVPQPVYLAWTCGVPPVDLAAKQQASGESDPARAGRPRLTARTGLLPQGQVTARSTGGQRQVGGRSTGGRPGVHHRYTPGQWRLAAWACAPFRYP